MKENILAKRYANAIYMFCIDKKLNYTNILEMLKIINNQMKENSIFLKLLSNKNIQKKEKIEVVNKILENYEQEKVIVDYLITKDRILLIDSIIQEYILIYNEAHNIIRVDAIFAKNITEEQLNKLIKKLEIKFNKNIDVNVIVDSTIIGGGIIKVNDKVIDGSYKNQLSQMTKLF